MDRRGGFHRVGVPPFVTPLVLSVYVGQLVIMGIALSTGKRRIVWLGDLSAIRAFPSAKFDARHLNQNVLLLGTVREARLGYPHGRS
jgi:hypothetical protein